MRSLEIGVVFLCCSFFCRYDERSRVVVVVDVFVVVIVVVVVVDVVVAFFCSHYFSIIYCRVKTRAIGKKRVVFDMLPM